MLSPLLTPGCPDYEDLDPENCRKLRHSAAQYLGGAALPPVLATLALMWIAWVMATAIGIVLSLWYGISTLGREHSAIRSLSDTLAAMSGEETREVSWWSQLVFWVPQLVLALMLSSAVIKVLQGIRFGTIASLVISQFARDGIVDPILQLPGAGFLNSSKEITLRVMAGACFMAIAVNVLEHTPFHFLSEIRSKLPAPLWEKQPGSWDSFVYFSTKGALVAGMFVFAVAFFLQGILQAIATVRLLANWNPCRLRLLDNAAIPATGHPAMRIAHLSDLHVTATDQTLTTEKKLSPNKRLVDLIHGHRAALLHVDAVCITGDVTDTGRSREWARFFEIFDPDLRQKLILVPGNHDLNIVDPQNYAAVEHTARLGQRLRIARMLSAMDAVMGARAWVFARDSATLVSLREELYQSAGYLPQFVRTLERPQDDEDILELWARLFPMWIASPVHGLGFVILDSNRLGRTIASNALGEIGPEVMKRLRHLRDMKPHEGWVVLMHHHLGLPSTIARPGIFEATKRSGMVLRNARETVQALRDMEPLVVLHGHRHVEYHGRIRDIQICSARSSTLGDESPCDSQERSHAQESPGFRIHEVVTTGNGGAIWIASAPFPPRNIEAASMVNNDG